MSGEVGPSAEIETFRQQLMQVVGEAAVAAQLKIEPNTETKKLQEVKQLRGLREGAWGWTWWRESQPPESPTMGFVDFGVREEVQSANSKAFVLFVSRVAYSLDLQNKPSAAGGICWQQMVKPKDDLNSVRDLAQNNVLEAWFELPQLAAEL